MIERSKFTVSLLNLVFLFRFIECGRHNVPRVFSTPSGSLSGMLIPFANPILSPVEAIGGIQYGVAKRFNQPLASDERWTGRKIFLSRSLRGVCYQPISNVKRSNANNIFHYESYSRRLEPYIIRQSEDCLAFNLYVPAIGDYPVLQLDVVATYFKQDGRATNGIAVLETY
ncbi:NLGN [Mytilus coruscus]|uniref:NLGN n=1 Tax=Mytilus coruscus TaxID=42192 RepID=A0A6J8DE94_MYTCO|nr:NLGN [Mytilus coruscus]